jgi:hypothetical protein
MILEQNHATRFLRHFFIQIGTTTNKNVSMNDILTFLKYLNRINDLRYFDLGFDFDLELAALFS